MLLRSFCDRFTLASGSQLPCLKTRSNARGRSVRGKTRIKMSKPPVLNEDGAGFEFLPQGIKTYGFTYEKLSKTSQEPTAKAACETERCGYFAPVCMMPSANTECPPAVEELFKRLSGIATSESLKKGMSYQPNKGDVLISTGIKCGTAWVQQILHGLRSRGNMDFDEIDSIIPYIELYYDYEEGGDLESPQPFEPPRYFKMHATYELTVKGFEKQVIVTRNPKDAIVSAYFFFRDWLFDGEKIHLDEFVKWMVMQDASDTPYANADQMRHLVSWYPHRKDANVLWLHYEDLEEDLPYCIQLIAEFVEVGVEDPKLLKLVEEQASFDFMKKHKSKFNTHQVKVARNEYLGLPRDHGLKYNEGRVRNGKSGDGMKLLSEEMSRTMDMKWRSMMQPVIGCGSYEEMRAAINKELGRSFGKSA